ncbi:chloride intracellular channel protein 6-like [Pyrus ussuriensis x Pyrus communis]|uniref:Chloride intracellular channel protein 6-like n=1 Tax=Pyrus ussuriensis x Pyrus communis TaxID=2448454 RepID=A0A5N5H3N3_9ROSA|nr:chloride intracellular channel protein 6-like [Pyrus ussuriensis x Pyrus communis]
MDISSPSGKSVLLNVDRLQGLQPSANQEQIRTLLEDYLVSDLVSAVGESLNIRGIGEESIDVKDVSEESFDSKVVGEESIDAKGVGEESIDAKGVGEESKDVGELSIDSKDVGEVSIDAKVDVGKVSIDAKGVGEESIDAKGVGEESKDVGELSIDSKDVGEVSIDAKDVGKESIDIKGVGVVEHAPDGDNTSGVEKRNTYEVPNAQQGNVTRKCLNKCATFPIPIGVLSPNASSIVKEEPEEVLCGDENHHHAYLRSVSLPSPSKLLSALKGSRAKEGLSPGKLSVKWAPDVYDPPATSMSHTVTGKKQQKSKNKKNWKKDGKKGQKSSSSRGKDKKQYRKSGSSGRCYRSMDPRETLVDTNNGFGELVLGSPDRPSYCGSSILKNSLANMHYPVAEAS